MVVGLTFRRRATPRVFFAPDLRHYNPLFLFRKIIVDAILQLGHKPMVHNRLNKKSHHFFGGVWISLVRRTTCDVTAGKFVVIRTSFALVLIYKF